MVGDVEESKNQLNMAIAIFEEQLGADNHKTVSAKAYLDAVDTLPTAISHNPTKNENENLRNAFLR